ncbi:MAG TPA: 2'-5' RNA ligase family protein [Acetobacteraceae bacterium]|nr:2'-5' RNA ligase family protein [Acetobacteraceae bacterium]
MPFAITLRLDDLTAPRLAGLWEALAAAGIDTDCRDVGYPPHITLGIYADDASMEALGAVLPKLATNRAAIPIAFAGLGLFIEPAASVWAVPAPTEALLACHAALLRALPDVAPHQHYRRGTWVPHVTLSGPLRDPASALAVVLPLWRPTAGLLDRVELVRFRPVEVVHSAALPAPA